MKRTRDEISTARWLAGRLAWALLVLALGFLVLAVNSAQAQSSGGDDAPTPGPEAAIFPFAPTETEGTLLRGQISTATLPVWVAEIMASGIGPNAGDELLIHKAAETGVAGNTVIINGETITYTITISNPTTEAAQDIAILDVLPKGALDSETIECSHNCTKINDETIIDDPLGGSLLVTVTRQISWEVSSLAPGAEIVRHFSGRLVGQADGTEIKTRAFINYTLDGNQKSGISNYATTIVRVDIEVPGQPNLSSAPTWFSDDQGGTIGLDWGDWDSDGYLDLALASTMATSVYRNESGRLKLYWSAEQRTYGVGWADLDGEQGLELAAVGDSESADPSSKGINFVYNWAGDQFTGTQFTSERQLVRVAPGDYDGDGFIDLVVSTNSINADCPAILYKNTQNPTEPYAGDGVCISEEATAALGPVDYSNDNDLDLALGEFPNLTYLLVNSGTVTSTNPFTELLPYLVEGFADYLPYDFAWGDYNGDGFLDLAVAFPLERRVRVYQNQLGDHPVQIAEIRTSQFRTPLTVDWGDFNGDGCIDLAVADSPPKIYKYSPDSDRFVEIMSLKPDSVRGEVWTMRAADQDNDGDLDLALTNRDGPSMIFTNFAPQLMPTLSPITFTGSAAASSVAWGDADGDGDQDLLFGAGQGAVGTKLFFNDKGTFPTADATSLASSGFGPHVAAWGDVDGDYHLDIALVVGISAGVQLYESGNTDAPDWTSAPPHFPGHSLAWADADDDDDLDLLVGREGPNALFVNQDTSLVVTPTWVFTQDDATRSIAWGDFDNDRYQDIAVGNDGANRIFRNNHDNTFSLIWTSTYLSDTTSVAWADYDGDGFLDLAVGNTGQSNLLYRNKAGKFDTEPIWHSDTMSNTTSLAWGDWNNDGVLDLAVGNDGEPDQVYANLTSFPGSLPQLYWIWTSNESAGTTAVAWGDADDDGDLDLAVSQQGGGKNGFYQNTYIMPSHLVNNFATTMPLPNNPSYVSVERPGLTPAAYFQSSAELLSGPNSPTVTISYKLFDPDGTRDDSEVSNLFGDEIVSTHFDFSMDGGATWQPATPIATALPITKTRRGGQAATFLWDAVTDEAISDNARFRVRIVPDNPLGPVKRASISAISPPFRVRGTSCVWPRDPFFSVNPSVPEHNQELRFDGGVLEASDILTYTWDFGDDSELQRGQVVYHTYALPGTYQVRMTARSRPCPIAKEVIAIDDLFVAQGPMNVFLPMISKDAAPDEAAAGDAESQSALSPPNWLWLNGAGAGPIPLQSDTR